MRSPGTLPNYRQLKIGDVDEARALYGNLYTSVSLEQTNRRRAFAWTSNITELGPVMLASSTFASAIASHTDAVEDIYSLCFPVGAARGEVIVAGAPVPFLRGKAGFLVSPKMPAKIRFEDNFSSVQLTFRRQFVEEAFLALHGTPVRGSLQLSTSIAVGPSGAASVRLAQFLFREAKLRSPILASPLLRARYAETLIHTLLAEHPHNQQTQVGRVRSAGPAHLRRAEEFVAAHPGQALTLTEIAGNAGVSTRALQAAFRRHRDYSPMQFLRKRRLLLARQRLLQAGPGETVAEIALDCGFNHLGRFSQEYREAFGEAPSETLRRR